MFDSLPDRSRSTLSQPGIFKDMTDPREVADFPWPDLSHLDFSGTLAEIAKHPDKAVMTGFWSSFYHEAVRFFGMENFFAKMYGDPEVVLAVLARVVDALCEANDRFFAALGGAADIFFFGNDMGNQLNLMISPELFDRFVLPGMKRLIGVAKRHGKKVVLHSCGSVYRIVPRLIEAGVDGLHPLQARAANMEADRLAREFGGRIAFIGGVDTQELLMKATPAQVRDEVLRLRAAFGPNYVVSPSHEAILPNVPYENVAAMARAAREEI
jgi:uroporphyrinogen decarboxylase